MTNHRVFWALILVVFMVMFTDARHTRRSMKHSSKIAAPTPKHTSVPLESIPPVRNLVKTKSRLPAVKNTRPSSMSTVNDHIREAHRKTVTNRKY